MIHSTHIIRVTAVMGTAILVMEALVTLIQASGPITSIRHILIMEIRSTEIAITAMPGTMGQPITFKL